MYVIFSGFGRQIGRHRLRCEYAKRCSNRDQTRRAARVRVSESFEILIDNVIWDSDDRFGVSIQMDTARGSININRV